MSMRFRCFLIPIHSFIIPVFPNVDKNLKNRHLIKIPVFQSSKNIILSRFKVANLADPTGFEPAIFPVTGDVLTGLHHGSIIEHVDGRNRTSDLGLMSPTL